MIRPFFIILTLLCSCGQDGDESSLSGGSLSLDYGGSFSRLPSSYFEDNAIDSMIVKFVSKPIGLGIQHNFLAVHLDDGKIYLLGLNARDDFSFYKKNRQNPGVIHKQLTIEGHSEVLSTSLAVRRYLNHHPYRNPILYGTALVATPVAGRPCSHMARSLFDLISQFRVRT